MARSISVKVPTAVIIREIEDKLAEIDKSVKDYPALREQYEKDIEVYRKQMLAFVLLYLSNNEEKIIHGSFSSPTSTDVIRVYRNFANRVELSFSTDAIAGFPEEPAAVPVPNQPEYFGNQRVTKKALLEKNLRILKMTSQEEVSATTYGALMEIL